MGWVPCMRYAVAASSFSTSELISNEGRANEPGLTTQNYAETKVFSIVNEDNGHPVL